MKQEEKTKKNKRAYFSGRSLRIRKEKLRCRLSKQHL